MLNNQYFEAGGKIGEMLKSVKTGAINTANTAINSTASQNISKVADSASKVLDNDLVKGLSKYPDNKQSIITRSKNTVLQFPVFISESIPTQVAHVLSKTFERVYASFVQSALSQHPIINVDDVNGAKFLRQFHSNIMEAAFAMEDLMSYTIDTFDEMMTESVLIMYLTENGISVFYKIEAPKEMIEESNRLNSDVFDGFKHYFGEATKEKTVRTDVKQGDINPAELANKEIDRILEDELGLKPMDPGNKPKRGIGQSDQDYENSVAEWEDNIQKVKDWDEQREEISDDIFKTYKDIFNAGGLEPYIKRVTTPPSGTLIDDDKLKDRAAAKAEDLRKRFQHAPDTIKRDVDGKFYQVDSKGNIIKDTTTITRKTSVSDVDIKAPSLLKDNEIKKINAIAPFAMTAEFAVEDRNGNSNGKIQFIIGVKTILNLVQAQDLVDEMDDLITGKEKNLQKVRYKTGEIKTADYIFQLGKNKKDARNAAAGKWTSHLKKLVDSDNTIGHMISNNHNVPNATLILSTTDVNMIRNKSGYDLNDTSIARRLCSNMFMIAIAIIDATAGTMKVLFPDIGNSWDVQSLASIDAEVSKSENSAVMHELQKALAGGLR